MILKRHIQGRGQKTFAELLKLMALKVGLEWSLRTRVFIAI